MICFWGPKLDLFLEPLFKIIRDPILGPKTNPIFGARNWPRFSVFCFPQVRKILARKRRNHQILLQSTNNKDKWTQGPYTWFAGCNMNCQDWIKQHPPSPLPTPTASSHVLQKDSSQAYAGKTKLAASDDERNPKICGYVSICTFF